MADFQLVDTLVLSLDVDNNFRCAVIDTANGFAYFGNDTSPGTITKINLSNFTRVGMLTLNSGEGSLRCAVIDTINGFAYFGTNTTPAYVIKINLSTFTRVGAVSVVGNNLFSGVIDTTNGFAYFGDNANPSNIYKINLSTFTLSATLTLNTGERILYSAVIDTANGFAYFGTNIAPAYVVKINLSTFTRVGAVGIVYNGENGLSTATIDAVNGFAYFGDNANPGPSKISKINLSTFTLSATLTLNTGDNHLYSAQIDSSYAYFLDGLNPVKMIRIRLSDFSRVDEVAGTGIANTSGYASVIDITNKYLYFTSLQAGIIPANLYKASLETPYPYGRSIPVLDKVI